MVQTGHVDISKTLTKKKLVELISEKGLSLYTMSERYCIVPELRNLDIMQYRELIVSPWRKLWLI